MTKSRTDLIKSKIHQKILALVDLRLMESLSPEQLRGDLKLLGERLLDEEGVPINESERRSIVQGIQNEMLGLGPIEPLLADSTISDILVNGPDKVFVERRGRIELTDVHFENDLHLLRIINKIVSHIGRRVDELSPMVDARLDLPTIPTKSYGALNFPNQSFVSLRLVDFFACP